MCRTIFAVTVTQPQSTDIPRRRVPALAVVNDYEVVVRGVANMLAPFEERLRVVDFSAQMPPTRPVDVTLYDTFASPHSRDGLQRLVNNPLCGRVVVYSWNTRSDRVQTALEQGASGYLPKSLSAEHMVDALERVHSGEIVTANVFAQGEPGAHRPLRQHPARWPGQEFGLTARESEMVALITQGWSNNDIATQTFLSLNTVKSYIRSAYYKIGVESRPRAVIWGRTHDMLPDCDHTISRGKPSSPGGG